MTRLMLTIDCNSRSSAPHSPVTLRKSAINLRNTVRRYTPQTPLSMKNPTPFASTSYDVDAESGFVPRRPLSPLRGQYSLWEHALAKAQGVVFLPEDDSDEAVEARTAGEQWRVQMISWPVLDISEIAGDLRSLQRAHKVLAWLVHFFAHSHPASVDKSTIVVPKALSVPLVKVSELLRMAPVLTYADTVLWNWEFINPSGPLTMDNIRVESTFSNTDDERSFFLVSLEVELYCVEALGLIAQFQIMDKSASDDIAASLHRLQEIIEDITTIVQTVRPLCNPHVFYWQIRPWFEGVDANPGPEQQDWEYDGVERSLESMKFRNGPSGGQSCAMHALDVFLGVDHAPAAHGTGFMARMRHYMPGFHREFLENLENKSTLRNCVQNDAVVRAAYNETVMEFKKMRDVHMRVASQYILKMSAGKNVIPSVCPASAMLNRLNQGMKPPGVGPVRGTGGNEVITLLRAGIDATRRTVV